LEPLLPWFGSPIHHWLGCSRDEYQDRLGYLSLVLDLLLPRFYLFFLVPKTANKSLEQISQLFGDHTVADEEAVYERIRHQVWTDHAHIAELAEVEQSISGLIMYIYLQ